MPRALIRRELKTRRVDPDVYFSRSLDPQFNLDERQKQMPSYLVQVAYTSDAMAAMIKKPHDRASVVGKAVAKLGGSLREAWLTFGDYDTVVLVEMPDNVSAAAFAMAVSAGGSCSAVKTTPLLSIEEGITAMKKAGGSGYKPVGGK